MRSSRRSATRSWRPEFVGPAGITTLYRLLLGVHILLSILSVPLVIYQVVTGWAFGTGALPDATRHPTVGRVTVAAWTISLSLGVLTYLLLNHVYDWEFVAAAVWLA